MREFVKESNTVLLNSDAATKLKAKVLLHIPTEESTLQLKIIDSIFSYPSVYYCSDSAINLTDIRLTFDLDEDYLLKLIDGIFEGDNSIRLIGDVRFIDVNKAVVIPMDVYTKSTSQYDAITAAHNRAARLEIIDEFMLDNS